MGRSRVASAIGLAMLMALSTIGAPAAAPTFGASAPAPAATFAPAPAPAPAGGEAFSLGAAPAAGRNVRKYKRPGKK